MSKLLLKVGILSDSQCNGDRDDWGVYNLEQALALAAREKVGLLFTGGDLTETGDPAAYALYRELFDRAFGKERPAELHCIGNHDLTFSKDPETRRRHFDLFCDGVGQSRENPCRKTVGGYEFIAFHTDPVTDRYTPDALAALEKELRRSVTEAPGRPVFIYTHYPPYRTVTGSSGNEEFRGLRELLDRFPEAVSLSGHFHIPLEDERSFWQGEFTAVATATLNYGCIKEKAVNLCGPIPPFAREVVQMLILEIYPEELRFRRFSVTEGREIEPGRPWRVFLPYTPREGGFPGLAEPRRAPEFAPGTRLLTRYDYGFYYLIFDGTEEGDFTHFYDVEIAELDGAGAVLRAETVRYVSDFYRLPRNREKRAVLKLPGELLQGGKNYRIRVRPVETSGKRGGAIETLLHPPAGRAVKSALPAYPQE